MGSAKAVCVAVSPWPVNVLAGGSGSVFTVANLAAAGVRRIRLGSALSRAALGAVLRAGREVLDQGTFTFAEEAASFAELSGFMAGK